MNTDREVKNVLREIFYPMGGVPFNELKEREEIDISEFILAWDYRAYVNYLECY